MSILLKAIHSKCVDCSGGSVSEARLCHLTKCPLWPFRQGRNPFAKPRGQSFKANGSSDRLPLFAAPSADEPASAKDAA
jgi:hypothetical protein